MIRIRFKDGNQKNGCFGARTKSNKGNREMIRRIVDCVEMTIKNEKGKEFITEAKQFYEKDGTPYEYLFIFDQEVYHKMKFKLGYDKDYTAMDEFGREYRVEEYYCNEGDYEIQFYKVA